MQKMVANLQELGFEISEKDCLKASGGEAVGRPHIVKALLSINQNHETITQLREKMKKDAKNDPEIRKKYDEMISRDEKLHSYDLFLTDTSYISNIYVDYQYFVDLDTSVKLIRDAGGVAILAHYFRNAKKLGGVSNPSEFVVCE